MDAVCSAGGERLFCWFSGRGPRGSKNFGRVSKQTSLPFFHGFRGHGQHDGSLGRLARGSFWCFPTRTRAVPGVCAVFRLRFRLLPLINASHLFSFIVHAQQAPKGQGFYDLKAETLDGSTYEFSELKGKVGCLFHPVPCAVLLSECFWRPLGLCRLSLRCGVSVCLW